MKSTILSGLKASFAIIMVLGFLAAPALVGQTPAEPAAKAAAVEEGKFLKAIGAGIVAVGAGVGIGMMASAAVAGISRQPEASGDIRVTMIIGAALIEGVALVGLLVCAGLI